MKKRAVPKHWNSDDIPSQRIRAFRQRLMKWYDSVGRSLPWRFANAGPYERVVTEVLLQRTRAETVATFYERFFATFPDWPQLAAASPKQLRSFLKPIGLWRRRATSLHKLANAVLEVGKILPKDRMQLETLPAVGQYVASAALLFYHNKPEPLLDAGMARVLERHFGDRVLADIRYDPYLQRLSRRVVKSSRSAEVNWAILDLAALVCKTSNPLCASCPVQATCEFGRPERAGDGTRITSPRAQLPVV